MCALQPTIVILTMATKEGKRNGGGKTHIHTLTKKKLPPPSKTPTTQLCNGDVLMMVVLFFDVTNGVT